MLVWIISLEILPGTVHAQLELRTNEIPQSVFAGSERPVAVTLHNPADRPVEMVLRTQMYQAGSATVVPLGEPRHWKELEVLPQQTVVESTRLAFPAVKKETRFLVQWLDEKSRILGNAEVMAYPTNLLEALKPLAGEKPLGVFDPQNQLKPLLKNLALEFEDLADVGFESYSGRLAIIGPFQSRAQMREGLADRIRALAKKGTAIVWVQSPPEKWDKIQPSFYSVPEKQTGVVVVQPGLVADLPDNPQSQLNLVYFCQLALHPENPSLPDQPH